METQLAVLDKSWRDFDPLPQPDDLIIVVGQLPSGPRESSQSPFFNILMLRM